MTEILVQIEFAHVAAQRLADRFFCSGNQRCFPVTSVEKLTPGVVDFQQIGIFTDGSLPDLQSSDLVFQVDRFFGKQIKR
jgi:hypothetical protein